MLDVKLAQSSDGTCVGSSFSHYSRLLQQRSLLQTELESQQGYANLMNEMVTYTTLTLPEESPLQKELQEEATAAQKKVQDIVCNEIYPQNFLTIGSFMKSPWSCFKWRGK